jgi:beta-aspartyl-peptidase (threonine type)
VTAGFVIAVHGGAGTVTRASITPDQEAAYRAGIERALRAGHDVLAAMGSALDAVVAAVKSLEDDPLFNAGRGSVFTSDGLVEMDAAVMDGTSGRAGAVAGVTTARNPVVVARAVMERTRHVLLGGAGADRFAADQGLELAAPEYFYTQHRWNQLEAARKAGRVQLDHHVEPADRKFGTVGAVARDGRGHLAAATSTGGLTNKLYGRIGDTPLIGAGTYADDATAAVSCTGTGEFFMRGVAAHDLAARMRYGAASLDEAARAVVHEALATRGGSGGLIAVDAQGRVAMPFNTEGMYRGVLRAQTAPVVSIYADEAPR